MNDTKQPVDSDESKAEVTGSKYIEITSPNESTRQYVFKSGASRHDYKLFVEDQIQFLNECAMNGNNVTFTIADITDLRVSDLPAVLRSLGILKEIQDNTPANITDLTAVIAHRSLVQGIRSVGNRGDNTPQNTAYFTENEKARALEWGIERKRAVEAERTEA